MDKFKELFGDEALTYAQLEEKLKDNKDIKLANLESGHYVDINKYEEKVTALKTAESTIKGLQETVAKFDGVDVDGLKGEIKTLKETYDTDIAAVKLDNAVNLALVEAKAKNPKLAKAALDMSLIKLDGDKLLGLSEQLDGLKASDAYLFEVEDTTQRVSTGAGHSSGSGTDAFMQALMQGAGLTDE